MAGFVLFSQMMVLRPCLRIKTQASAPVRLLLCPPSALSPALVFFNGANIRQVDVPTQTGAFGILAAHVPTLQVLRPGLVVVHAEDGTTSKYFVSSGSVTVNADSSVQLLAEEAVTLDMLDLGAAKANLEKAQSELSGAADEVARAEIQIRIEANEALVKALE